MNPSVETSPQAAAAAAGPAARSWTTRRDEKNRRLAAIAPWLQDGMLPAARIVDALEH
jgi:malonate decarboxylase alpha subunit